MPPRHHTLPAAQTAAAREAQKSFYCQLCSKGYTRMNDYEAHLSSYDHSHKQRLRDLKQMVRDPNASRRAREAEARADGLVSIKTDAAAAIASGGGFKKGGFKKSGFKSAFTPVGGGVKTEEAETKPQAQIAEPLTRPPLSNSAPAESDTEDEGYEVYDPRFPTD